AEPRDAGGNAVQNEMRALNDAMRDSVTAIAWDDYAAIPKSLHHVHEARAATEHALESGAYVFRRNADRREEFVRLDEAFHHELEKLEEAASAKDPKATPAQLGVVLGQCHGCHETFR